MQVFENYISGVVRLTSPLYVADLDEKGKTMTRPVFRGDGKRVMVPYFPANDFRGRLRRKAAKIILDALAQKGARVPLETYMGLQCGSASGQPDRANLTVEEAYRSRSNVYMGLFGGGARVLPSRFSVADLLPIVQATIEAGCVPSGGDAGEFVLPSVIWSKDGEEKQSLANSAYDLTSKTNMVRRDDVANLDDYPTMQSVVENCDDAVMAYQNKILANSEARKNDKKSGADQGDEEKTKKSDLANIFSAEEIAPGVRLWNSILLDSNLTLAQLGLLLSAFASLVKEQRLGGASRRGNGRFVCEQMVVCHSELASVELPIFVSDASAVLSPQVAPALEAMTNALNTLDVQEINSYFINRFVDKKAAA